MTPTRTFRYVLEDEFDSYYRPIPDPVTGSILRDWHRQSDRDDIERAGEERRLWTVVDGDDGEMLALSGYHLVNRFAYIVTEVPWAKDEDVECVFDTTPDEGETHDLDAPHILPEDYRV